jgi:hypothetical protein
MRVELIDSDNLAKSRGADEESKLSSVHLDHGQREWLCQRGPQEFMTLVINVAHGIVTGSTGNLCLSDLPAADPSDPLSSC